jgi:hypothetical protein
MKEIFIVEQIKKKSVLLVSIILGTIGLVFWFIPLVTKNDTAYSLFSMFFIEPLTKRTFGGLELEKFPQLLVFLTIYMSVAMISNILAIFLNILGWLKNDAKKLFLAAIFYILTFINIFTIPSVFICFICSAKIKANNRN